MSLMNGITITLGEEEVVLEPSIKAALQLSKIYGGIAAAQQKILQLDMQAYITVIRLGSNIKDKDAEGLAEKIFRAGMTSLMTQVVEYLILLNNGGKKPGSEEIDDETPAEGNA